MAVNKTVSASTQSQTLNNLGFIFKYVLKVDVGKMEGLRKVKRFKKLTDDIEQR